MIVAISTAVGVLAFVGLAVGVVVLLVVIKLFNLVLGPALEIDAYASHILTAGVGIATNLDGADEIARTHELATAVPGLAIDFLERSAK